MWNLIHLGDAHFATVPYIRQMKILPQFTILQSLSADYVTFNDW